MRHASNISTDRRRRSRQAGFSYVEVLVATALVTLSLVPALEALQTGVLGSTTHESVAVIQQRLMAKMGEVLAQPFADLESAEFVAAGAPTSYSDAPGTPDRRLVLLSRYDGNNADADNDPFTGTDDGLLWVRVEIENSSRALESLSTR